MADTLTKLILAATHHPGCSTTRVVKNMMVIQSWLTPMDIAKRIAQLKRQKLLKVTKNGRLLACQRPMPLTQVIILETLPDPPLWMGWWKLIEASELSPYTVSASLAKLKKKNLVEHVGKGKWRKRDDTKKSR